MYCQRLQPKFDETLRKYNLTQKRPYSNSYYSEGEISWGSKPENSYRFSDHWNFISQSELHCITECGTTNGWYVGQYHNGIYTLIEKVFTDEEYEEEQRCRSDYFKEIEERSKKLLKEKERIFAENRKSKLKVAVIKKYNENIEIERSTDPDELIAKVEEVLKCLKEKQKIAIEKKLEYAIPELKLGGANSSTGVTIVVESLNGRIYKKFNIRWFKKQPKIKVNNNVI